ncbi:sigma-54-dependent transcriptional regulator [Patiriisocius marinus]|uniref:sigma-54-dependent transcriptional regulator n=1 Tax=Patiriisocius marinus TaxID=1397112 RepID=UPI002795EA25|nr:sigma-54 dependent transcriptional regulator [Patiriisocius marinus]
MKILIVEDDIAFGKMLHIYLSKKEYEVSLVTTGAEATPLFSDGSFDVLITDLQLPDTTGLQLLEIVKEKAPTTQVLLMTGYAEVSTAVDAMKKGALEYISKPFRPEELLMILENVRKPNEVKGSTIASEIEAPLVKTNNSLLQGISKAAITYQQHIQLVSPTTMAVLIQGESGTGKEVAAKAIHDFSDRCNQPFIAVDCGAIPKEIASSEFFGHIKGSFTGAIADKKGHFENAHLGTLFLDEVGNLSYENQIQLLRALQEKKIKPVGSSKEIAIDIRVLSATNENLREAVERGDFREDLYHRLQEFTIHIPPLREREEDLQRFISFFIEQANVALNKNVKDISKEVAIAFDNYAWPGNLRELKNVLKRCVLLTTTDVIPIEVLPHEVLVTSDKKIVTDFSTKNNEKQLIINALKQAEYNKSKAAGLLKITRKTLYNKIAHYAIDLDNV